MWRFSKPIRKLFARTTSRSVSIRTILATRAGPLTSGLLISMKLNTVMRAGLQVAACAVAFSATEVWNTKDPSVWTAEDANVILNKSPWAKQIKVAPQGMGQRRPGGMGRRGGGMGYPGGGYPGGGYP